MIPFCIGQTWYHSFLSRMVTLGFNIKTIHNGEIILGLAKDGTPFFTSLFLFRDHESKIPSRATLYLYKWAREENSYKRLFDIDIMSDESLKAFAVFVILKTGKKN